MSETFYVDDVAYNDRAIYFWQRGFFTIKEDDPDNGGETGDEWTEGSYVTASDDGDKGKRVGALSTKELFRIIGHEPSNG